MYCNNPNFIQYYGINLNVDSLNSRQEGGNIIDNSLCLDSVDFYCPDLNSIGYYGFDNFQQDYNWSKDHINAYGKLRAHFGEDFFKRTEFQICSKMLLGTEFCGGEGIKIKTILF